MISKQDRIDLEKMVWNTLSSRAREMVLLVGGDGIDEKSRIKRVVDSCARIPPEPDMPEAEAEGRLERMRDQIFALNEEDDDFDDDTIVTWQIDPEDVKRKWKAYNQAVTDHQDRRHNLRGRFLTKSIFIAEAAAAKICELSQAVTVFDSTGNLVSENIQTLQGFIAQGRQLTIYAPTAALDILAHTSAEKHDLSEVQTSGLQSANIRALIVGDGTGGAYFKEENLKDQFLSTPAMRYYAAALWERTCNLFRDNKSFTKQQELDEEKKNIPIVYFGLMGFGNPEQVAELRNKALEVISLD